MYLGAVAKRLASTPRVKKQVNCRLYRVDVEELQRRAREDGDSWQVRLRKLVHASLLQQEKKVL